MEVIGGHWRSLEVDLYQSRVCLDDKRGFWMEGSRNGMGWMDGMVIIGRRWSKSTFGVNNIYPEQAGIALLRLTLI